MRLLSVEGQAPRNDQHGTVAGGLQQERPDRVAVSREVCEPDHGLTEF
jgi:hypothetical protein